MASHAAATPAVASATLDRIKPPAGVIMPPPGEMREVIEKTAGYAVRGGAGIEARLRENHSNNPRFSFVTTPDDPYHAYYEWRKEEYRAGRVTAVAAGRVAEGAENAAGAAAQKEAPKGPEKPADYSFSARLPIMNAQDMDVLRLTASFVAVHGRRFQTSLMQREVGNAQFAFLAPTHSLNGYYQRMVDQYVAIHKDIGTTAAATMTTTNRDNVQDSAARLATLRANASDRFSILLRAKQRIAYAEWEQAQRKKEEHERDVEKEAVARIDWTNFAVLETIVFGDEDEVAQLPPPTSLNDLQYASLEQKSKMSIANNRMIEEAFPF